ncbi:MAG: ABC transporter permease [Deltaproteobacteria bacterium]|nr:ABC transporter permease [Deltaproteobacteria bacterium]
MLARWHLVAAPRAALFRHRTCTGTLVADEADPGRSRSRIGTLLWELRQHRHALRVLVAMQYRSTHRAQALGVFWPIANPLILTAVVSVVFGRLFPQAREGYPVFLLIGLVLWNFLSHAWLEATDCLMRYSEIVKRTELPPYLVIVATILSNGISLGFSSLGMLPLLVFYPDSFHLSAALFLLPLIVVLVCLLGLALSLASAPLNVLYRDVGYLVGSLLLMVFWLTPIVYPVEAVSDRVRGILFLNPMTGLIECVRDIVMDGEAPPARALALSVATTLALFVAGALTYRRFASRIADHV